MTENGSGNAPGAVERARGSGSRVADAVQSGNDFVENFRSAAAGISSAVDLKGRVDRNPYGVILVAIAGGYVLGGGLFTRLTARSLRFGIALSALPFVKGELLRMAENALDGFTGNLAGAAPLNGEHL